MVDWTKGIVKFIRDNSDKLSDKEIANELNVKINSIRVLRNKLGISKDRGKIRKRLISIGKIIPSKPSIKSIENIRNLGKNQKGKTYEELFGEENAKEMKRKSSERMKVNNPSFKPYSKERLKKMSESAKERWKDNDYRKRCYTFKKGDENVSKRKDVRKKHRESAKKQWRNRESRDKLLKGLRLKPNNPEKYLIRLIKKNNLPLNYVGDGKIWFKGKNHIFNPDFLSKNPKHIIEIYGEYHHNLPYNKKKNKERIKTYSKYGYKTLIIWSKELNDSEKVLKKIFNFLK